MTAERRVQIDFPDLSIDRCTLEVGGESSYGAGDQVECGCMSAVICASQDCVNSPCEGHAKRCPACQQYFCESSDKSLETCFFEHVKMGKCQEILRVPLSDLARALASSRHRDLETFVNRDSDGLGHPLPKEVCVNLAL